MEDNPYQPPVFSEPLETGAPSLTEEEIRAFVGKRAGYYLRRWSGALEGPYGRARGFNWPAFLLSGFWIPYRKMYRVATTFFSIIVAMSLVETIAFAIGFLSETAQPTLDKFDRITGLVLAIVCGMFGNSWYLAHAKREIARIRDSGLKGDDYYKALAKRGGTNVLASLGLFVLFLVAIVVVSVLPSLFLDDPEL